MFWNVLEVGMGDLPVLEKRLMTFRWVPDLLPRQDNARLSKTCKFKPVREECGLDGPCRVRPGGGAGGGLWSLLRKGEKTHSPTQPAGNKS